MNTTCSYDSIAMPEDVNQREILEKLRWPDRKETLAEQVRAALALTPTQRLDRVEELRRLCLAMATAAGNLEAAKRYREWREAEWRKSIQEAIRLYEQRSAVQR